MDKVLFVATVDQHIRHFHLPFLEWFKSNGYEVHVASYGDEDLLHVDKKYNICFQRSPLNIDNLYAFRQLKELIRANNYKIIHCHTPMGGVLARLASISERNKGMKVIYTAHGFHFYKGAPLKNWILYYPVEKFLSKYTDVLITINDEDYELALNKAFKANIIKKVNGVGIDLNKYKQKDKKMKLKLRETLGYNKDDFILIYVGELSYRKHQDFLIKVVNVLKVDIPNLKLLLVGKGEKYDEYSEIIDSLGLNKHIDLMGYRSDVHDLMGLSDIVVSSSRQEGLPVNIMEAMAMSLPIVVSDCRGNKDLITDYKNGFIVKMNDLEGFTNAVRQIYRSKELNYKFSTKSTKVIKKYSLKNVLQEMENIYKLYL